RHGLGLYIYAGEDLPDSQSVQKQQAPTQQATPSTPRQGGWNRSYYSGR
ncbi:MAG: DUF1071 domain-containing protein, partial [Candidatus Methanomethylophilaceae archaeon]|nr:DUF1071 domain-containing protein [Candidatus Methanomethylophilaceae archaeon]